MAAELRLYQSDLVGLVDDEDLDGLLGWRWIELGGYIVRQQRTPTGTTLIYLHRWLMKARPNEVVDHINNNRLDNRRSCNLRLCSQSENLANRPAPMPHGYRGVYPERSGSWRAQIKVNGRNRRLGTFQRPEAAARAYDVAALAAWGRFARLNFPGETPAQLELPTFDDLLAFATPAPSPRGMDFYELSLLRQWSAARAVAGDALTLAEQDTGDCDIPY